MLVIDWNRWNFMAWQSRIRSSEKLGCWLPLSKRAINLCLYFQLHCLAPVCWYDSRSWGWGGVRHFERLLVFFSPLISRVLSIYENRNWISFWQNGLDESSLSFRVTQLHPHNFGSFNKSTQLIKRHFNFLFRPLPYKRSSPPGVLARPRPSQPYVDKCRASSAINVLHAKGLARGLGEGCRKVWVIVIWPWDPCMDSLL